MVHDENRPAPPVITPGDQTAAGRPLRRRRALRRDRGIRWRTGRTPRAIPPSGSSATDTWRSVKGAGYIQTKQQFGSCQLHVEFATPAKVQGTSQGRGNSGVFLQGQYEVQVLDSYENKTYPDGQCGALYGRAVPLVNACRKPGEWQSYDIIYPSPDSSTRTARSRERPTFTIFQNGVLVQDHVELDRRHRLDRPPRHHRLQAHRDKGPIQLQDHGNPVRYRNIWVRELKD